MTSLFTLLNIDNITDDIDSDISDNIFKLKIDYFKTVIDNFYKEYDNISEELREEFIKYIKNYSIAYLTNGAFRNINGKFYYDCNKDYDNMLKFIIEYSSEEDLNYYIKYINQILLAIMKNHINLPDKKFKNIYKFCYKINCFDKFKQSVISSQYWWNEDPIKNEKETFLGLLISSPSITNKSYSNILPIIFETIVLYFKNPDTNRTIRDWLKKTIQQNYYKGQEQNIILINKGVSEQYMITFLGIMLKFWIKGSSNKDLVKVIDPRYCVELVQGDNIGINGKHYELDDDVILKEPNFRTECFFMVQELIGYSYYPMAQKYKMLLTEEKRVFIDIKNLKDEEIKLSFEIDKTVPKNRLILKKKYNELKHLLNVKSKIHTKYIKLLKIFKDCLTSEWIYPYINQYYADVSLWINYNFDPSSDFASIEFCKIFSEKFLNVILETFLSQNFDLKNPLIMFDSMNTSFLNFLNYNQVNNPNLIRKILQLITSSKSIAIYSLRYMEANIDVTKNIMKNFVDLKESPTTIISKINMIWFINYIAKNSPVYIYNLERYFKIDSNKLYLDKFIWSLFSSMNTIFDNLKSSLEDISKLKGFGISSDIIRISNCIRFYNEFILNAFELTKKLGNSSLKKILLLPDNIQKIVLAINYFNYCITKNNKNLFDLTKYIKKNKYLKEILDIILLFKTDEIFLEFMVNEQSFYNSELYRYSLELLSSKNIFNWHTGGFVIETLYNIDKKRKEIKSVSTDKIKIPEDFVDPILLDLIENPVQLPASKKIVSRSGIVQHLRYSKEDPFSRAPLTKEDLEKHNKLESTIREIELFQEKINVWKSENGLE